MSERQRNAQYITLHFRLLDRPAFGAFMRSAAFPVYLLLRRYIWRGERRHPVAKVNDLHRAGHLVSAVPRKVLAERLGFRDLRRVSRLLAELEERGAVRKVFTGRLNVYMLGSWKERGSGLGGARHESFFVEEILDSTPAVAVETTPSASVETTSALVETTTSALVETTTSALVETTTSALVETTTSALVDSTPINREKNREKNKTGRRRPFEPLDLKERWDDVLVVED